MSLEPATTAVERDRAGASARWHVRELTESLAAVHQQMQLFVRAEHETRRQIETFGRGAAGEEELAARVADFVERWSIGSWRMLTDRRWPGTRNANIDLILVGPPGVLVLDAKLWSEAMIVGGHLLCGQHDASDEVTKVSAQAHALGELLVEIGLPAAEPSGVIVLVGSDLPATALDGIHVVGSGRLVEHLLHRRVRLRDDQVARVTAHLEEHCLAMPAAPLPPSRSKTTGRRAAAWPPPTTDPLPVAMPPPESSRGAGGRAPIERIMRDASAVASQGDIETWMTWLHPDQARLTGAHFAGPARIRGSAGTGKTVVALHRAHFLARQPNARVLVLSFGKTLSAVHGELFRRIAPDLASKVEFATVHGFAMHLLHRQGLSCPLDGERALVCFDDAWEEVGTTSVLARADVPRTYWLEEISRVIKGRNISSFDDYRNLERLGRRVPLQTGHRAAVWALYEAYRSHLARAGVCDHDDLLSRALEAITARPGRNRYTSVIVDEVQDLTVVGVRLAHALVGDAPDGLLLVGDGEQRVLPGGFTLSEAGVRIAGARSTILTTNFRNGRPITERARKVLSGCESDDIDDEPVSEMATELVRIGGRVIDATYADALSRQWDLVERIRREVRGGTRPGDIAVLCATNGTCDFWIGVLEAAGLATMALETYRGRRVDAIKVGTFDRAKGLEFASVLLPIGSRDEPGAAPAATSAERERISIDAHRLYVAMTRARDTLWIGRVAAPIRAAPR